MSIVTGGWAGAISTWGWGGGGGYVPPTPPAPGTDLIPTLDDVLVLRPLLESAGRQDDPDAPGALMLQPALKVFENVSKALLAAFGLSPAAFAEGPSKPSADGLLLAPSVDTDPPTGIDLSTKPLAPRASAEIDEDPAVDPKNLRPKLKGKS